MPIPGLSLVGFMQPEAAVAHLATACLPDDPNPVVLLAEWQAAKARLGPPVADAGHPAIEPIPASHADYVERLQRIPWVAGAMAGAYLGGGFRLVEIDQLFALQFTVSQVQARHHCGALGSPPSLDQLLEICLPMELASGDLQAEQQAQSVTVRSRSLNLQTQARGIDQGVVGVTVGWTPPFVFVTRLRGGPCFLSNGYNRAYGAALAGARRMPCLFREVDSIEQAGVRADGTTFPAARFDTPDAPTVGHFTRGRAHAVRLRAMSWQLRVSWTESILYEE